MKINLIFLLLLSNAIFSQDKVIKQEILDESCNCIRKINIDLSNEVKNDSIKSCIVSSIVKDQTNELVQELKKSLDTLSLTAKDTVINQKSSFKIEIDKDYQEIQNALMKECEYLKLVLNVNNEQHKNSYSDNKKAMEYYKEGEKYFNKQQYDLALVEYSKAIKKDDKFAFAWDNLGICYRKLERYKEAIKCYKKSLELDPKGKVPLMNMAVAYNLLGDTKNAIKTYERFIEVHPKDAEGYYGISRLQNFAGEYADALENALKAFVLYDNSSSPYKEDALNVIREIVVNLKKENKIHIFNDFAEKHGIEKIKE